MNKKRTAEEIREQILEAANLRFQQYGYNKTTMAEIAEDCRMSAANLYRHFKNKMDIVAHLAEQCMAREQISMRHIVNDEGRSAAERLLELVLVQLHHHHREFTQRPKLNELVDVVCQEHHELLEGKIEAKFRMLVQLLQQGVQQGEFAITNLEQEADAVQAATVLFSTPFFIPMFPLEELERKAEHTVELILRGLLKR